MLEKYRFYGQSNESLKNVSKDGKKKKEKEKFSWKLIKRYLSEIWHWEQMPPSPKFTAYKYVPATVICTERHRRLSSGIVDCG